MKVACIGAGVIGRAWAVAFARGGCDVAVYDAAAHVLSEAYERIGVSLRELERAGLIDDAEAALARVSLCGSLELALAGVAYVQESVAERADDKRRVFEAIAAAAPRDAILASSTSAIPGSRFLSDIDGAERCIVAHPTNPPFLTPLTELCPTSKTSAETITRAREILEAVGQKTILLNCEITGYVLNRLQAAVVAEALHLVGRGIVSARDLDAALTHGLGLRWCFMGPFLTGHLNADGGYRGYMEKYGGVYREIAADLDVTYDWSMDVVEAVHASVRGDSDTTQADQAWRDRRLMGLLKHIAEADRVDPRPGAAA